jgi:hypothetical protein
MVRDLAQLRREWLETRAPEVGVAFLQERRRLGELGDANVRLAAYLGGPLSRRVLSEPVEPPSELEAWIRGLAAWGRPVEVRAGFIAARLAAPLWETAEPRDLNPRRTLTALEEWLEDPSERTLARVGANRFDAYYQDARATVAAGALSSLATSLAYGDEPLWSCGVVTATVLDPLLVRRAIAHGLASWALGYEGTKLAPPPALSFTESAVRPR